MRPRRWRGIFLTVGVLAFALLGCGFAWFVINLPDAPVPAPRADGIVVLTGSATRINDGLDLLSAGQAKRLLISGVNPATRTNELARLTPAYQRWFDCCVDVGRVATNTIGNALETRDWARQHDFTSVIVVTSDFHMPRAMAEIAHELPGVTLVPFPVVSERMRSESWWTNPTAARLLIYEYLKYIVATARLRLESAFD
jgi:uncharacterized SAM-binding protein YcdF (DUF218 family)